MGYTANDIRNVCLLGHGGDGKSALCESMLFMTKAITRLGKRADGTTQEALYLLRSNAVLLTIAALGATPLPRRLCGALESSRAGARVLSVLEPLGVLTLLVLCTAYLVDGTFSPFLYFRF